MSNPFDVGRGTQICKTWTSNGGGNWGLCCKKWQDNSFVSDDVCEAIAKNLSAQLDESDLIQKKKWLKTAHKKYSWLSRNSVYITYVHLINTREQMLTWGCAY